MRRFSILLTLLVPFAALAGATELPAPIVRAQELLVAQGECEARWPELARDLGVGVHDLDHGRRLYLVPCAFWAHNPASTAYLVVPERTHPDGFIVKPQHFLAWSPDQGGLYATNLLHNVAFDPETRRLGARFHRNGFAHCGQMAIYEWRSGQQNFRLARLIRQDDCRAAAPWTDVALPRP